MKFKLLSLIINKSSIRSKNREPFFKRLHYFLCSAIFINKLGFPSKNGKPLVIPLQNIKARLFVLYLNPFFIQLNHFFIISLFAKLLIRPFICKKGQIQRFFFVWLRLVVPKRSWTRGCTSHPENSGQLDKPMKNI